jgi:hypothetical protein
MLKKIILLLSFLCAFDAVLFGQNVTPVGGANEIYQRFYGINFSKSQWDSIDAAKTIDLRFIALDGVKYQLLIGRNLLGKAILDSIFAAMQTVTFVDTQEKTYQIKMRNPNLKIYNITLHNTDIRPDFSEKLEKPIYDSLRKKRFIFASDIDHIEKSPMSLGTSLNISQGRFWGDEKRPFDQFTGARISFEWSKYKKYNMSVDFVFSVLPLRTPNYFDNSMFRLDTVSSFGFAYSVGTALYHSERHLFNFHTDVAFQWLLIDKYFVIPYALNDQKTVENYSLGLGFDYRFRFLALLKKNKDAFMPNSFSLNAHYFFIKPIIRSNYFADNRLFQFNYELQMGYTFLTSEVKNFKFKRRYYN